MSTGAAAGATTISVGDTTGFAAGQIIAISGDKGPFGLGFASGSATSTIASVATSTITLDSGLASTHFNGGQSDGHTARQG